MADLTPEGLERIEELRESANSHGPVIYKTSICDEDQKFYEAAHEAIPTLVAEVKRHRDERHREICGFQEPHVSNAQFAALSSEEKRKVFAAHFKAGLQAGVVDALLEAETARVRELEKAAREVADEWAADGLGIDEAMHALIAALDGAKGETHGPRCHICHGKGWLNTADQNALEDKGGDVAS